MLGLVVIALPVASAAQAAPSRGSTPADLATLVGRSQHLHVRSVVAVVRLDVSSDGRPVQVVRMPYREGARPFRFATSTRAAGPLWKLRAVGRWRYVYVPRAIRAALPGYLRRFGDRHWLRLTAGQLAHTRSIPLGVPRGFAANELAPTGLARLLAIATNIRDEGVVRLGAAPVRRFKAEVDASKLQLLAQASLFGVAPHAQLALDLDIRSDGLPVRLAVSATLSRNGRTVTQTLSDEVLSVDTPVTVRPPAAGDTVDFTQLTRVQAGDL